MGVAISKLKKVTCTHGSVVVGQLGCEREPWLARPATYHYAASSAFRKGLNNLLNNMGQVGVTSTHLATYYTAARTISPGFLLPASPPHGLNCCVSCPPLPLALRPSDLTCLVQGMTKVAHMAVSLGRKSMAMRTGKEERPRD